MSGMKDNLVAFSLYGDIGKHHKTEYWLCICLGLRPPLVITQTLIYILIRQHIKN